MFLVDHQHHHDHHDHDDHGNHDQDNNWWHLQQLPLYLCMIIMFVVDHHDHDDQGNHDQDNDWWHLQQLPVYLCMIVMFILILQDLHDHYISSWSSWSSWSSRSSTAASLSLHDHDHQNRSWPRSWCFVTFDWVLQSVPCLQQKWKTDQGKNVFGLCSTFHLAKVPILAFSCFLGSIWVGAYLTIWSDTV